MTEKTRPKIDKIMLFLLFSFLANMNRAKVRDNVSLTMKNFFDNKNLRG